MADLKTTYKDDVLNTSKNQKRKYNVIQNADGTISLEDVTEYTQVGDSFGASDINTTNAKVNEVNSNLTNLSNILSTISENLSLNNAKIANIENILSITSHDITFANEDTVIGKVVKYGKVCYMHVRFTSTVVFTDNTERLLAWIPKSFAPYDYNYLIVENGEYENDKNQKLELVPKQVNTSPNVWDGWYVKPLKSNINVGDFISFDVTYISYS